MKPKSTGTMQLRFRASSGVFHAPLPREEGALRLLVCAVGVVALGYVVFVSSTIINIVAQREAVEQAATLRDVVSTLEREYFPLSHAVTAESGSPLGLSPVEETHYIRIPSGALSAGNSESANRNEI